MQSTHPKISTCTHAHIIVVVGEIISSEYIPDLTKEERIPDSTKATPDPKEERNYIPDPSKKQEEDI